MDTTDKSHRLGKKQKCVKPRKQDIALRLGEDIQWGQTMDIVDRVLVGRVQGRSYTMARLKQWTNEVWGHHLVELPFVQPWSGDGFPYVFP